MLAALGTMVNKQGKRACWGWFGTWPCSSSLLLELLLTVDQSWDHRPWLQHPELPWVELAWGAAQLPVHFTISRFAVIRIILSSRLGGWDATAGLGQPEAALSSESCWGGAVSADHFCQLPVAAQLLICASSPL